MADHWSAEENSNFDPPWVLIYDPTPGGKKNADGSTSYGLRFPALQQTEYMADPAATMQGLADDLNSHDRLQAENKALREALEPFAALAAAVFETYETVDGQVHEARSDQPDDRAIWGFNRADLTLGALRAARAALASQQDGGTR